MAELQSQDLEQHVKTLYHTYRHAPSLDSKGLFFSPSCLQICRPTPSYCATSRSQIVQYLKDAQQGAVPLEQHAESEGDVGSSQAGHVNGSTGRYTIRPLLACEHEFGDGAATAAIGLTPAALRTMVEDEGWIGMRVDLWDEGTEAALLVKVQYWWRLESQEDERHVENEMKGKVWRQCLHDIMYLAPKDGTEGEEGLEVLC